MTTPGKAPLLRGDGYLTALAAERAKVLRARAWWYCVVILALILLSLLMDTREVDAINLPDAAVRHALIFNFVFNILLFLGFASMMAYLQLERPSREHLIRALAVLTVVGTALVTYIEVISVPLDREYVPGTPETVLRQVLLALGDTLVFQGIAMLMIPMRWRESLWFIIPSAAVFLTTFGLLVRKADTVAVVFWIVVNPACACILAAFSAWRYRLFDSIDQSRAIEGKFGELSTELAYARRIHEALFPPQVERGPVEIHYRYEPMREIGGDFLFIHPLSHPPAAPSSPTSIVLIDVSGHGVPAALAVNRLHDALQRFFSSRPDGGPGQLLEELNSYACECLAPQGVFASVLAVRIDPRRRRLDWASAGHPPAYLRADDSPTVEMPSTATMLGVLPPGVFDAAAASRPLPARAVITAFTDGAYEASDPSGDPFGLERLKELIARTSPGPRAPEDIAAAVATHRADSPVRDDLLIVRIAVADAAPGTNPHESDT